MQNLGYTSVNKKGQSASGCAVGFLSETSSEFSSPPDLQLVDWCVADIFAHRKLRSCHGQERGGGLRWYCGDRRGEELMIAMS